MNNGHIQNHTFCLLLIFIIALIVITADVADTNNDIQLLLIDISTTQLNRLLCLQKLCGVLNNNECDKFVLRKIDSSNKKKCCLFLNQLSALFVCFNLTELISQRCDNDQPSIYAYFVLCGGKMRILVLLIVLSTHRYTCVRSIANTHTLTHILIAARVPVYQHQNITSTTSSSSSASASSS